MSEQFEPRCGATAASTAARRPTPMTTPSLVAPSRNASTPGSTPSIRTTSRPPPTRRPSYDAAEDESNQEAAAEVRRAGIRGRALHAHRGSPVPADALRPFVGPLEPRRAPIGCRRLGPVGGMRTWWSKTLSGSHACFSAASRANFSSPNVHLTRASSASSVEVEVGARSPRAARPWRSARGPSRGWRRRQPDRSTSPAGGRASWRCGSGRRWRPRRPRGPPRPSGRR